MQDSGLTKYILVAFILAAAISGIAPAQIRVFAQVESTTDIYIGETFDYRIIIDGEEKPGQVELAPLAKYNPQSLGGGPASQTSIRIINGKTTRNVIKRYVMNYSLTVTEAGRVLLPSVAVTVNGTVYKTNPVELNILKAGTTDQLNLEVTLSEQQCYVGQPVIITVKFYVSADVASLGEFNFNIPVLTSDDFYLEDPDIINPQAKQYRLSTGGITVFVSQYRTEHKGRSVVVLSFSKILIPKSAGRLEMAASSVSAEIAVGRSRRRSFFGSEYDYKRFMVSSKPSALTVLSLPEVGKPSVYYGLVGRYTIASSAVPTQVNVGDPITLTIKIGGNKYLKPVQWPALEKIPEMAANFKIPSQKASPTIEGGWKVFTQTIRANNDKIGAIPSIPLAFFDSNNGRYTVIKTQPIQLEVAPTKILTNADLEGTDFTPVNKEVEAIKKGLSANYEGFDVLQDQNFALLVALTSPGYMALWGLPLAGLVLSSLLKFFTHTSPEKTAAKRRRQACGKAVRQLKKITSSGQQRHELLASIMKQYIGERFDKTAGSLTADDCSEVILTHTTDIQTAKQYRDIIAQCEAARYSSTEADIDLNQLKNVIELVRSIEKKSKK